MLKAAMKRSSAINHVNEGAKLILITNDVHENVGKIVHLALPPWLKRCLSAATNKQWTVEQRQNFLSAKCPAQRYCPAGTNARPLVVPRVDQLRAAKKFLKSVPRAERCTTFYAKIWTKTSLARLRAVLSSSVDIHVWEHTQIVIIRYVYKLWHYANIYMTISALYQFWLPNPITVV